MQNRQSSFWEQIDNIFPPVEAADSDGLLAWSTDLNSNMLLAAYCRGIFPWPVREKEVLWFAPPRRAVLDLRELKISRNLLRDIDKPELSLEINRRFPEVIEACSAAVRKNQEGTWITARMRRAYQEFHQLGFAFSFEAVDRQQQLAGGLYGIWIGGFFAGESMFHRESGASKFALIKMLEWLRDQAGVTWIDTQTLSPLMIRLGAREIDRAEYSAMLAKALRRKVLPPAVELQQKQEQFLCNLK